MMVRMERYFLGECNLMCEFSIFEQGNKLPGNLCNPFLLFLRFIARFLNWCTYLEKGPPNDQTVTSFRDSTLVKRLPEFPKSAVHWCADICRAVEAAERGVKTLDEFELRGLLKMTTEHGPNFGFLAGCTSQWKTFVQLGENVTFSECFCKTAMSTIEKSQNWHWVNGLQTPAKRKIVFANSQVKGEEINRYAYESFTK